jgi:uncharacterized protein involved in exopolysaccharide biosynthesis
MSIQNNNEEEKELSIDFKALYNLAFSFKWLLLLVSSIFGVVSAIYLFNKPNEYTSVATVMPEFESNGLGGGLSKYAGLATLAGINVNGMAGSDAIRPDLYPNVINNTTFFLYLLNQKVQLTNGQMVKFEDFYLNIYKIDKEEVLYSNKSKNDGFIQILKGYFRNETENIINNVNQNKDLVYLSKKKGEIITNLMKKVSASMDKKTGIISVSAQLPDPLVSAQVAKISMDYLTTFVTNYRTEKARKDVNFLAERLLEAKNKYYNTQTKKAQYSDQFAAPTIRFQSADIQRERIESDYRVTSSFYQQLLQQYENAKLKVQQETPVFKTLQQPVIPYMKSGPKRLYGILSASFVGFIIGFIGIIINSKNRGQLIRINWKG